MAFPGKDIAGVIPRYLPEGTLDKTIPQSGVDMPFVKPDVVIVTRHSDPDTRYVFQRQGSIAELYMRLCSDDRAHMLEAALSRADITYFSDKNAYVLNNLIPKAHIGTYKTGDTKEEFTILYR